MSLCLPHEVLKQTRAYCLQSITHNTQESISSANSIEMKVGNKRTYNLTASLAKFVVAHSYIREKEREKKKEKRLVEAE